MSVDINPIMAFLPCATPMQWVDEAAKPENLTVLLTDHANCERKAAESALATIKRYGANQARASTRPLEAKSDELLQKLSRLAREEIRHFGQVISMMKQRHVRYRPLSAGRYAGTLRGCVRKDEPARLVDTLIVGALVEARSCERFAALAPRLEDAELAGFYGSLLKSEARHFQDYLKLAGAASSAETVAERLAEILPLERNLIESPDSEFRFHSGLPEHSPLKPLI